MQAGAGGIIVAAGGAVAGGTAAGGLAPPGGTAGVPTHLNRVEGARREGATKGTVPNESDGAMTG